MKDNGLDIVVLGSLSESLLNFRGSLLAAMVRSGNRVTGAANENVPEVTRRLAKIGVNFVSIPMARAGLNPLRDFVTLVSLTRLFRGVKPDLVLAYTIKPVIYGLIACRVRGIRRRHALITGLGYSFTGKTPRHAVVRWVACGLYRLALKGAAKVIFQNPDDMNVFQKLHLASAEQCLVVNGSGVDLRKFRYSTPRVNPVRFLLIARLLVDKGIREFVDAARSLTRKYPGAEFVIVGPRDPNPAGIEAEEISGWQSEAVVKYLGPLDDVRPVIEEASVYVLPSYREGTPRTVLEAMAMGRPIVTTDAPGCRETVLEGINGFLVPVRDVPALGAAMEKFILHPELVVPMGKKSREIAEEKYDVTKVDASIMDALGISREKIA